jgi:hypothetical protein
LLALFLAALVAVSSPAEDLSRARVAYEQNDWPTAIRLLRPLLHPKILLASEADVETARKLLGSSYYFTKDETRAKFEFRMLLDLNPGFTMDRIVDGAEITRFVGGLKAEIEAELRRIAEAREKRDAEEKRRKEREAAERRRKAERIYLEVTVRERPWAVNLLPFGAGQFQNRQSAKAWGFLAAEGALATASLTTFAVVRLRWPTGQVPERDAGSAASLELAHIVTGGLFFVVWGLGVLDALENYNAEEKTTRELPKAPAPPVRPRLSLSPTGLQVTW